MRLSKHLKKFPLVQHDEGSWSVVDVPCSLCRRGSVQTELDLEQEAATLDYKCECDTCGAEFIVYYKIEPQIHLIPVSTLNLKIVSRIVKPK